MISKHTSPGIGIQIYVILSTRKLNIIVFLFRFKHYIIRTVKFLNFFSTSSQDAS
jgi:hypothetical protein